jgi:hypothetical protein
LIKETSARFLDHETEILDGKFGGPLLHSSRYKGNLEEIEKVTAEKVFLSDLVIPVEIAGFRSSVVY